MDIRTDFLPRVEVEETKDSSFSHTGQLDFTKAEPEIKTLGPRLPNMRPRTRVSQNNSYT